MGGGASGKNGSHNSGLIVDWIFNAVPRVAALVKYWFVLFVFGCQKREHAQSLETMVPAASTCS